MSWPRLQRFLRFQLSWLAWAAWLALAAFPAAAQDLEAYRNLSASLDAVTAARQSSPARALTQLDAADKAFEALAPTLQDRQLKEALETTLKRSKAALGQSPHALRAQTEYARALLRRALYDQTLADLAQFGLQGDVKPRLETLGQEFGLEDAAVAALLADAKAGELTAVAARLQRQAADKVVGYLHPVVVGSIPYNSPSGYAQISRASGWQLMLSGTRGLPNQSAAFQKVLALLAKGNGPLAQPLLEPLYARAQQTQMTLNQNFADAAAKAEAKSAAKAKPAAAAGAQLQTQPSGGDETDETEPSEFDVVPPLGSMQTTQMSAGVQVPPLLQTVDTDGNTTGNSTATASAAGMTQVQAALSRAVAESLEHNTAAVRAELRSAAAALGSVSLPSEYLAQQQEQQQRLLALAEQSSISTDEVISLIPFLHALEQGKAAAPSVFSPVFSPMWNSSVQLVSFLVLALLAPIPVYLAFKAIGRQGYNWSQLAWGVGCLIAPLVLEGVAALGLWLADVAGIPALSALGWLSIRHSPAGQALWWIFSLGGIVLLTFGFQSMSAVRGRVANVRHNWNISRHSRVEGDKEAASEPAVTRHRSTAERREALARLAGRLGKERLRRLATKKLSTKKLATRKSAGGAAADASEPEVLAGTSGDRSKTNAK